MSLTDYLTFEWWAQIWIPAALGAATVVVSIAALVASGRATKLAHDVERQRVAAQDERERTERRLRLQEMALVEARALQRWLSEVRHQRIGFGRSAALTSPLPRSDAEEARLDAEVLLTQSLVPGAQLLFDLTSYDIRSRDLVVPDGRDTDEGERAVAYGRLDENDERTAARIRDWALDPEGSLDQMKRDWNMVSDDGSEYIFGGD
ncbi:hypothetical protein N8K70_02840 [Microbacterium betulae]|uniref:Uncharacterized protein n=1 Tax=Microbacterium betulae TaxID=2981139 RepID=A0AA97FK99_9MICO|nr:hypothetical protein [Microbacterium sp. AB]WOF23634.1 hypothetical protein N8K70_02840 [Microbacterium sp. AB]